MQKLKMKEGVIRVIVVDIGACGHMSLHHSL